MIDASTETHLTTMHSERDIVTTQTQEETKTAKKKDYVGCINGKRHRWTLDEGTRCGECKKLNTEVGHPKGSEKYTLNRQTARDAAKSEVKQPAATAKVPEPPKSAEERRSEPPMTRGKSKAEVQEQLKRPEMPAKHDAA